MFEEQFKTPEELKAYKTGFTQGFARSVEMQAKIRLKRNRERIDQTTDMIHILIQAIGLDKFEMVIHFVEELGVLVLRK